MASSSSADKSRQNAPAYNDGDAPEHEFGSTGHAVCGSSKEVGMRKKGLWKKVFPRSKDKEERSASLDGQLQQMEMERQKLLPKYQENEHTSNHARQMGAHENYQSIRPNVSFTQQLTREPALNRNNQTGPLQIAWPDVDATGLIINVKPMCRLLSQPEIAHLPVAIFSINGTTRGGKSFLLNQAVKFLKFGKSHPNDWIDQKVEEGFDWSFRMDSVTEGIQVWSEPFVLEEAGEKLALILLDNQGLADIHTSTNVAYKLFCLSNLLSSVFTYCDTEAHRKHYLESLHTFMQFSNSVEHERKSADERNENLVYTFGKLILLYRDFRFVKEFPCVDGCSFYDKTISSQETNSLYAHIFNSNVDNVSTVVREKRTALLQFYDDILVSTMMGPGNREPNNTDRISSSSWDPDFKRGLVKFVENVFSYKFMSQATKNVSGHVVTAETLVKYVENWAKIISEENYNISDITGLEASRDLYYSHKIEQSLHLYRVTLDRIKQSPEGTDIRQVEANTIKVIERRFWSDCEYGDWRAFYMKKMQAKISAYTSEQSVLLNLIISRKRKRIDRIAAGSGLVVGAAALILILALFSGKREERKRPTTTRSTD